MGHIVSATSFVSAHSRLNFVSDTVLKDLLTKRALDTWVLVERERERERKRERERVKSLQIRTVFEQ